MRLRSHKKNQQNNNDNSSQQSSESDSDSSIDSIMAAQPPAVVIIKKKLSKWSVEGLDITDGGLSKLVSKESNFDEAKKKKYDLKPETFTGFRDTLQEKSDRMFAATTFNINLTTGTQTKAYSILKEYSCLKESDIVAARDLRWPDTDPIFTTQSEADKHTDEQLKASVVGEYINQALDDASKKQLKADIDFFQVKDSDGNVFYDGPSYFFKIAEQVDPDNDNLIQNVRAELRAMNVKDYGFSIIKLIAEFKNMNKRILELGGDYSKDEQFLDFWSAVKTMKERKFARYVEAEEDRYRDQRKVDRKIEDYMKKFTNKETSMRNHKEWNVLSPEDGIMMALINFVDEQSDGKKSGKSKASKDTKTKSKDSDTKSLTADEKAKRKDAKIPKWKKEAPKDGEPTTKTVEDRTYHYCKKCRQGQGCWVMHTEDEHTKNFVPRGNTSRPSSSSSSRSNNDKKEDKTVKFDKDTDGAPKLKVKKQLLSNAKAYLAQFQDFQEGGTQGE